MRAPHGRREIVAVFGDPDDPDFEAKNIILFDLPYPLTYTGSGTVVTRSRAHRLMVPVLVGAFEELRDGGLDGESASFGGCYSRRLIRGGSWLSTHAWGIAIDLNPATNQLGTWGNMHPGVIATFLRHGFTWGGTFSRRDPMHFQFASGY